MLPWSGILDPISKGPELACESGAALDTHLKFCILDQISKGPELACESRAALETHLKFLF
jgi:hypothetical protein